MPRKDPKSITDWAESETGFLIADAEKKKKYIIELLIYKIE